VVAGVNAVLGSGTASQPAVHPAENAGPSRAYLRAAQAYMLISMPTGTSTIFGVFQAIPDLLSNGTTDLPHQHKR
jgi:hypothetical protein